MEFFYKFSVLLPFVYNTLNIDIVEELRATAFDVYILLSENQRPKLSCIILKVIKASFHRTSNITHIKNLVVNC